MTAPEPDSPLAAEEVAGAAQVYAYAFPAPARSPQGYALLILVLVLLAAFTAGAASVFGSGWIAFGAIGAAAIVAADEWSRFSRARFALRVDADGGLWVDTWAGSTRYWLPLMSEVEVARVALGRQGRQDDGMLPGLGSIYQMRLRMQAGGAKRIRLPGGAHYSPGAGPRMPDDELRRFAIAAGRWTAVKLPRLDS